MDCIGFCVACVVNISFAALGTDRAQERSLLAEVTILTHLSVFAASCVTAAGHKAITDPEFREACRGFRNSCKFLSCNLVPTYFWIHDWRHQIIFFFCCPQGRQTFSFELKIPFLLAAPSPLCLPDVSYKKNERSNSCFYYFQIFQVRYTRDAHIPDVYFRLVKGSSPLAWWTAFVVLNPFILQQNWWYILLLRLKWWSQPHCPVGAVLQIPGHSCQVYLVPELLLCLEMKSSHCSREGTWAIAACTPTFSNWNSSITHQYNLKISKCIQWHNCHCALAL